MMTTQNNNQRVWLTFRVEVLTIGPNDTENKRIKIRKAIETVPADIWEIVSEQPELNNIEVVL